MKIKITFKKNYLLYGFTLIEIMIVLAIIGILGAISFTMYESFFQTSYQAEVISKMKELQLEQTSYYAINDNYTSNLTAFSSFAPKVKNGKYILNEDKNGKRKYEIIISNCTNSSYTIRAENLPNSNKWHEVWELTCGPSSDDCKPELINKNSSILEKAF